MAIQWSGLGPELLLRLDRDSGLPLRSQLEDGIRDAIRDGRLQPGERLPSSREFARELGVSRGLVQECYGQLLSERGKLARSGTPDRKSAISRGAGSALRGGVAGEAAGYARAATRVAEPAWLSRYPSDSSWP